VYISFYFVFVSWNLSKNNSRKSFWTVLFRILAWAAICCPKLSGKALITYIKPARSRLNRKLVWNNRIHKHFDVQLRLLAALEQRYFWKADCRSLCEDTPHLDWTTKIYLRVDSSQPLDPIPSQMNSVGMYVPCLFEIRLNVYSHQYLCCPSVLFPCRSPDKTMDALSHLSRAPTISRLHMSYFL
jgi:hypothetical protein